MSRHRKGLRAVLHEITFSADRSPLFWWMVANHRDIAEAAVGRRLQWSRLCVQFAELGLTDVVGQVASERTARATWLRARRAVIEAEKRLAEKKETTRRKPPSRISPDWRPQEVARSEGVVRVTDMPPGCASVADSVAPSPPDFQTVDPSGVALPEGYVLFQGKIHLRRVAEVLDQMYREAAEIDRFK